MQAEVQITLVTNLY